MSRSDNLAIQSPVANLQSAPREPASGGDRQRLAQMAVEFESMLMLEMIKQMRQSMLGDDNEEEGLGADTFRSTIDTELARHLSQGGGLGLQAMMLGAWDRQQGTASAPAVDGGNGLASATATSALTGMSRSGARREGGLAGVTGGSGSPPGRTAAAPVVMASSTSAGRPELLPVSTAGSDATALDLDMDGRISSNFGWRSDPVHGRAKFHGGIDLAARYGTDVPAAAEGTVTTAGEQGAYGLTVVVRHPGGYESRYAHLSSLDVKPGDTIGKGDVVGRVGSTGRSTGPHLHFEVTQAGQRIDPDRFVRNLTGDIKGQ